MFALNPNAAFELGNLNEQEANQQINYRGYYPHPISPDSPEWKEFFGSTPTTPAPEPIPKPEADADGVTETAESEAVEEVQPKTGKCRCTFRVKIGNICAYTYIDSRGETVTESITGLNGDPGYDYNTWQEKPVTPPTGNDCTSDDSCSQNDCSKNAFKEIEKSFQNSENWCYDLAARKGGQVLYHMNFYQTPPTISLSCELK